MNTSKTRFILDLQKTQSQIALPVTRGDTAREWYITLSDGPLPYLISDGALAKLEIQRPTGTRLEAFCAIENNMTVKYDFAQNENTTAAAGIHECALILFDEEGDVIGSPRFTMVVSERVIDSDDIILSDEDRLIVESVITDEAARKTAETARVNAETARIAAETQRTQNEQHRQEAETARAASETARQSRFESLKKETENAAASLVSPTVSVEAVEGGQKVTLTDKNGEKTFHLMNGKDGQNGKDGYTPQKGVDYYTENEKSEISEYIASELTKRGQLKPEFAQTLADMSDVSKMYVLLDKTSVDYGYIFTYRLTEKEVESGADYTNKLPLAVTSGGGEYVGDNGEDGYREGYRYSASSNAEKAVAGYQVTGFIPAKQGDIVRVKGVAQTAINNDGNSYCVAYFFSDSYTRVSGAAVYLTPQSVAGITIATYENGIYSFTVPSYSDIVYFRVTLKGVTADTIITVNEEITENSGGTTTVTEYAWASSGHAFVPADYEDRIISLEEKAASIKDIEKRLENMENDISDLGDHERIQLIKTWDTAVYDANIPVFELSTEKNAITESEKTVAAVYAKYDSLMAKHPNYITKTNLGMCSDGVTPVYRYDFREPEPHRGTTGKKEWSETKAKAIIVSGIHWEWGGIFALYNALEELADNPDLFHLRRNTHLIVLPVCNPYAVANMSVRNANQVEIHRNFEVDFIYPNETGYIEIGEIHHGGTTPLSEIESQYIDNIFKENTDSAFFLTCHSNQIDEVYGIGFTWASPATYYMCNIHYRIVDKLSCAWMKKYGEELAAGIADYRTENTPSWDNRLGSAYLSTTNGTETKQAIKHGIQATNVEITDAFLVHGTKANPEKALSSFTMSRGAEVYINFLLTAFGCYDPKDKELYTGNKQT